MNINPASGTTDYYEVPAHPRAQARPERRRRPGRSHQELRAEMFAAAENLEFEKAARMRDELRALEGKTSPDAPEASAPSGYNPYASKRKTGTRLKSTKPSSAQKNWKAKQRRSSKWKPS